MVNCWKNKKGFLFLFLKLKVFIHREIWNQRSLFKSSNENCQDLMTAGCWIYTYWAFSPADFWFHSRAAALTRSFGRKRYSWLWIARYVSERIDEVLVTNPMARRFEFSYWEISAIYSYGGIDDDMDDRVSCWITCKSFD